MIKIEIKKSEKMNGINADSAFVSFDFDLEVVNILRAEEKRYYDAKTKIWELPAKNLVDFLNKLNGKQVELTLNIKNKESKVFNFNFDFKTKPFKHQQEGFEYGIQNDRFILGDEQGLGKTKQGIDIAEYKRINEKYEHCLIICGVNGLKWNWYDEIKTHSNQTGYILGQRIKKNGHEKVVIGGNKEKLEDLSNLPKNYFLITNIESLRNDDIANKIKTLCKSGKINMIIFDEIHKAKNPSSQQGKGLLKLEAKTMIGMSGTPLMNNPLDLFIVLKWLGFEKHNFHQFKNHYCQYGGFGGYEVVGYKNMGELREAMEDVMIRRLKKEVLDLPAKTYITEYVELGKAQQKIYDEVLEAVKENIDKIKLSPNPLAQLIRLRQATGYTGILSTEVKESAKLDRLEELVEETVANGDKVVIFTNWTDITEPAFERLKKYNPAIITGEVKNREEQKNKFMKDDNCKVIIGTIGAMGTGLTLTAANTAIFLDSPWNRANKEQAEDRIHRIGTKGTVNIITIVAKNTIDERIEEIIYKKGKMADILVDGAGNREAIQQLINNIL
jgi:SNF2 family DNA or RNA helicase